MLSVSSQTGEHTVETVWRECGDADTDADAEAD